MRVNWGNIHWYIICLILLNFVMIYFLKDKSENLLENENIIEITHEEAHYVLQKHSKSYRERKNQKAIKNKKNIEKKSKKKIDKLNKLDNQNKISDLNNIPFNNVKAFLEGIYINKEIKVEQNLNITNEEFLNENSKAAYFSIICLIIIVLVATYFQLKNHQEIEEKKNNNNQSKVDYILLNED